MRARPRQWMAHFLLDAPLWFVLPWMAGARLLFAARPGPLKGSPEHLVGWRILHDDGSCTIGLKSARGLTVRLCALTPPGQAVIVTQLSLETGYARALWTPVRSGHRFFAPYLLDRAARKLAAPGRTDPGRAEPRA